jgi:hypothetical protein
MFSVLRPVLLFATAGIAAACWLFPPISACGGNSPPLSEPEFRKLHRLLQPPRGEAWRSVPWELSVLEAREKAARAKKPVFMLVRSGHPLGCV